MDLSEIEAGIDRETLAELNAVPITPGRPLVAVDVDDVLVDFVEHLGRYIRTLGFEMRMVTYQLEGSIFPVGGGAPLPFEDCIELINGFFRAETLSQEAIPGGADVLARLEEEAQIVILTNVPRHATKARRANLDGLGLSYPMVVNGGGKGGAMAWLAARAKAPAAFVDDSVKQIESVAKHAPDVVRLHFAGAEVIRRLFPGCAHATEQVYDWRGCETVLRSRLLGIEGERS